MKTLFGILVIVNVNAIKHVILVSTQIIKITNVKKRLVDKLIDEFTETIDEVKLTKITLAENENSYKHKFCILYIALFSILFIIIVGISAYFVYYKYVNPNKKIFLDMIMFIKQKIIHKKWGK